MSQDSFEAYISGAERRYEELQEENYALKERVEELEDTISNLNDEIYELNNKEE